MKAKNIILKAQVYALEKEVDRLRLVLATQTTHADGLEIECEKWKAIATQVNTHWIPENQALVARADMHDKIIRAIVGWIEANQPDAFRRGLWDVLSYVGYGMQLTQPKKQKEDKP